MIWIYFFTLGKCTRSKSRPGILASPIRHTSPFHSAAIPRLRFSPSTVCAPGRRRHLPSPRPPHLLYDSSTATPRLEPLADCAPPLPSLVAVRRAPPRWQPLVDRRASRSLGASNRARPCDARHRSGAQTPMPKAISVSSSANSSIAAIPLF